MKTNPTDWYFSISDDDDDDFNESWLEKYPDSERPPTISLIHKAMFHKEKERYCDWHISEHVEHFMGPFHEVSENCFKAGYKDVKSSFEERMTKARSYFLSLGMEEFSESFEERNSPEFLASLNDYPREEKVTRELL